MFNPRSVYRWFVVLLVFWLIPCNPEKWLQWSYREKWVPGENEYKYSLPGNGQQLYAAYEKGDIPKGATIVSAPHDSYYLKATPKTPGMAQNPLTALVLAVSSTSAPLVACAAMKAELKKPGSTGALPWLVFFAHIGLVCYFFVRAKKGCPHCGMDAYMVYHHKIEEQGLERWACSCSFCGTAFVRTIAPRR
jgi:ribosomal protein S27AE